MTPPLYTASVPVLRHYLARVQEIAERAAPEALAARIADSFPAGQHFASAAGYALRIAFPLVGRALPELPQALAPRLAVARASLGALRPEDFAGAEARVIRHQAGEAWHAQGAEAFLHLYGMPNFLFHVTMGYATLRQAGMALGKADFDGFHHYPPPG